MRPRIALAVLATVALLAGCEMGDGGYGDDLQKAKASCDIAIAALAKVSWTDDDLMHRCDRAYELYAVHSVNEAKAALVKVDVP